MRISDMLKRWLGISGDNTHRARVITQVAEESARESAELNEQLRTYQKEDDPFKAMMIDLSNKRAAYLISSRRWHGQGGS